MLGFIVDDERLQVRQRHVRTLLLISCQCSDFQEPQIQPVRIQLNGFFNGFLRLPEQLVIIIRHLKIIHRVAQCVFQCQHRLFAEEFVLRFGHHSGRLRLGKIICELSEQHIRIIRIGGLPLVKQCLDSHSRTVRVWIRAADNAH